MTALAASFALAACMAAVTVLMGSPDQVGGAFQVVSGLLILVISGRRVRTQGDSVLWLLPPALVAVLGGYQIGAA